MNRLLFKSIIGSEDPIGNQLFEGYGEASSAEVDQLVKALTAQEGITDIATLQQGGALQMQSLETSLAMLTFQEKHIKFFKDIGISKAFSTLEEYSIQDGYGTEGGFVGQMENPEEDDADVRRAFAVVKYIRTLWKLSDVLPLTNTITSAEVIQKQAAMMRALRITERNLFFGNHLWVSQSFDGLQYTIETLTTADHVIDLRGAAITETVMRNASELIYDNFGVPTKQYLSPGVQTSIDLMLGITAANVTAFQPQLSTGSGLITMGHSATGMRTSFGEYKFEPDIFLAKEAWTVPRIKNAAVPGALIEGATSIKAPAMPAHAVVIVAPGAVGSLWAAAGSGGRIAGVYRYRVCAINQYGKSVASAADGGNAVAATGALTVNITPGAGAYAAQAYEIYGETAPASGVYRYITTVTAAAATYTDLNQNLPGTGISFLVDNTTVGEMRTMALSQLAPIHSVEYAKIAPYRWGTINFYIVPKWYAPLKYVMIKNIGVQQAAVSPLVDL